MFSCTLSAGLGRASSPPREELPECRQAEQRGCRHAGQAPALGLAAAGQNPSQGAWDVNRSVLAQCFLQWALLHDQGSWVHHRFIIQHKCTPANTNTDTHCSFPSPAVHHGGIYHPWTARGGRMAVVLRLCKYQHHLREVRGGRGYGSSQGETPEFCSLFNNGRTSSIVLSANGACPSDHISYISIP